MNLVVLQKFNLKHYQSFIDMLSVKSHQWCFLPEILINSDSCHPNLDNASFFYVSS